MTRNGAGVVKGPRPAMSLSEHQREIRDFLLTYNATEITFSPGGKHIRLQFSLAGRVYKYHLSKTPGDINTNHINLAGIRRLAGLNGPPPEIQRERRTINQLAAELPPATPAVPLVFVD
jgi:hypothetical protein